PDLPVTSANHQTARLTKIGVSNVSAVPLRSHRLAFGSGRGRPSCRMLTEAEIKAIKPLRYSRKVSDGGGLYLLVTPKGGRWWRYAYRFAQKHKALALGTYPAVPLERARARHEFARNLLAHGLDPSALKAALGKDIFI